MSDTAHSLSNSEEEDLSHDGDTDSSTAGESQVSEQRGTLSKWTNYIHGWQDRYVCCSNGTLCYYRNESESEYGCRGTISLAKALVHRHEFDPCRFDVAINDSVWYLRCADEDERNRWIDVIEDNKRRGTQSDAQSKTSLRRQGSLLSVNSQTVSINSGSSFRQTRNLKEKLAELDTFRDILNQKIETLQRFFDHCADLADGGDDTRRTLLNNETIEESFRVFHAKTKSPKHVLDSIDFRGEAITFKATTAGVLTTLSHCIDLMQKREETLVKKLEREQDRRRKLEEQHAQEIKLARRSMAFIGSPDLEEGPTSELTEEMFYECMEAELDKQDRFEEDLRVSKDLLKTAAITKPKQRHAHSDKLESRVQHHMTESMTIPSNENGSGDDDSSAWELFAEEGELKVYRRELVIDDCICDPLKAIHSIKLVTAREMCHYFWDTSVRLEWEGTIESFRVIEVPEEHTAIIYQTHKRVWPSAQRDCLYLSSMLKIEDPPAKSRDANAPHDTWMVCNFSVNHEKADPVAGCVRATVDIALICQTYLTPPADGGPITRDCLRCDIVYVANVNPGGWAPASVLRAIYKREYPKFLRKFTAYVQDKTKDKDIWF